MKKNNLKGLRGAGPSEGIFTDYDMMDLGTPQAAHIWEAAKPKFKGSIGKMIVFGTVESDGWADEYLKEWKESSKKSEKL